MQRRNLLIGMGSLAAGGAATIGTGAFTSVSADRSVSIETAGDASAFLGIDGAKDDDGNYTPNAVEYVDNVDGQITIDLTESDEGAEGINRNATTVFDNLLDVINNGSQEVTFWIESDLIASNGGPLGIYAERSQGNSSDNFGFDYPGDGSYPTSSDKTTLSPGDSLTNIGIYIPKGNATDDISGGTLTFKAVRTGGNRD